MGKPKQNIDDYSVNNFYPEALLIFMTIDKNGDPIRNLSSAFTTIPDISDIIDINLALGSTGKSGQFSVRINNKNNKYFVADDMEKEISNLKSGSITTTFLNSEDSENAGIKKIQPEATWTDAKDFLNNETFPRVYTEDTDNYLHLLYKDKNDNYKYKIISKDSIEAQSPPITKKTNNYSVGKRTTAQKSSGSLTSIKNTASNTINERINLSERTLTQAEVEQIKKKAKTQSAFFEEYGGQLENGRCVFAPMQLMVCLLTRRFKDENDPNDMIVAFTGFVDSVSDNFDGKTDIIHIQGTDVTKIMNVTQANTNPSLFEQGLPYGGQYKVWTNIFSGQQGWQIIKALILGGEDAEGNAVYGAGHFEYNAIVDTKSSARNKVVSKNTILTGLSLHPEEWTTDKNNNSIASDKLDQVLFSPSQVHIQILPFQTSPKGLRDLSAYKNIFGASFQNWQNEYRSHLQIANEVAQLTNYEFYADQFGDLWYHQPRFHNYHILTNDTPEVYVIRDDDILSSQFTESDKEVVTSVYVAGKPNFITISPQIAKMTAFYEDSSLLRKYGRRMISVSHPYITQSSDCFYFAKSWMLRINAGRFVGTVSIIGRPELRMHMPVYIASKNMIYYIVGIQHKFNYGQTFTTTLTLKYGRKPWEILPEILDYGVPDKLSAENPNHTPGNVTSKENVEASPTYIDPLSKLKFNLRNLTALPNAPDATLVNLNIPEEK